MSRENVDVVRRVYDAVATDDTEAVLALYDSQAEFDMSRSPVRTFLGRTVYRGREGVRSMFRERYEAWETIEDDLEELIDAGERVISVVTTRGCGRVSGAEVELQHAGLWTLHDGRIVRVEWLPSREAALEAAGLSE
jgi:ketosteroid isomerase-like protein